LARSPRCCYGTEWSAAGATHAEARSRSAATRGHPREGYYTRSAASRIGGRDNIQGVAGQLLTSFAEGRGAAAGHHASFRDPVGVGARTVVTAEPAGGPRRGAVAPGPRHIGLASLPEPAYAKAMRIGLLPWLQSGVGHGHDAKARSASHRVVRVTA
jgi:hypothetical protein